MADTPHFPQTDNWARYDRYHQAKPRYAELRDEEEEEFHLGADGEELEDLLSDYYPPGEN